MHLITTETRALRAAKETSSRFGLCMLADVYVYVYRYDVTGSGFVKGNILAAHLARITAL